MRASEVVEYLKRVMDTYECDPQLEIIIEREGSIIRESKVQHCDTLSDIVTSKKYVDGEHDVKGMKIILIGSSYSWIS